jgi:hypothetical protein
VIATILVAPTVIVPAWWVLRSNKVLRFMRGLIERLSLLTTVYLFFDAVGLVIVIIRNLS